MAESSSSSPNPNASDKTRQIKSEAMLKKNRPCSRSGFFCFHPKLLSAWNTIQNALCFDTNTFGGGAADVFA